MGFAVIHMMKIGKGGLRGIQSHNQREKEPHTNPDIDMSRCKDNYELIGGGNKNYTQEVNQRINAYAVNTKTVRKDAVVMCNFIVTSDEETMKAMGAEKQRAYFDDTLKFLGKRYGSELIVNATVHMDETTPHLHVGLVPVKDGRLSAKNIFTRTELKSLQTDFANEVGKKYGLERGIEGSERTHLSEQRFKVKCAEEKEAKIQKDIEYQEKVKEKNEKDINELNNRYDMVAERIETAQERLNDLNGTNNRLETENARLSHSVDSQKEELNELTPKLLKAKDIKEQKADKGLFGKVKNTVTYPYDVAVSMEETIKKHTDWDIREKELEEREKAIKEKEYNASVNLKKSKIQLEKAEKVQQSADNLGYTLNEIYADAEKNANAMYVRFIKNRHLEDDFKKFKDEERQMQQKKYEKLMRKLGWQQLEHDEKGNDYTPYY